MVVEASNKVRTSDEQSGEQAVAQSRLDLRQQQHGRGIILLGRVVVVLLQWYHHPRRLLLLLLAAKRHLVAAASRPLSEIRPSVDRRSSPSSSSACCFARHPTTRKSIAANGHRHPTSSVPTFSALPGSGTPIVASLFFKNLWRRGGGSGSSRGGGPEAKRIGGMPVKDAASFMDTLSVVETERDQFDDDC